MPIDYQKLFPAAVARRMREVEKKLPKSLRVAVRWSLLHIVRHVTKKKMLGQSINRITGTAIRSVTASPRDELLPDGARGWMGSNLGYVRALNEGFVGDVDVKAHTRRPSSRGRAAKKKRGGGEVRGAIKVRAHTRSVNMRARKFFQESFAETTAAVRRSAAKAIFTTLHTNKVATRNDLGG